MRVHVDARHLKRRDVGISGYLRAAVRRLIDSGAEVTLLTDASGHALALAAEHEVRSVSLPCASGFLWEQVRLPRWLRDERPDVMLAGAGHGLPLVRVPGVHRIAVVHDLAPLRMPRLYLHHGPVWIARYLASMAITLAVADTVITPSESTARDVRRLGVRRVRVRMPEMPLPTGPHDPPPTGWPQPYLLCDGGRDRSRNVSRLLDAFARYRNAGGDHHLVLLGAGHEEHAAAISGLGLGDAVMVTGSVDEEIRVRALAGAAAVVHPSSWESFGLAMAEAFAAGIPVVSGRGGAQSEIGGDAAIYVEVDNTDSIARGIRRAIAPEARERARRNGPRRLAELARTAGADALLEVVSGAEAKRR